MPQKVQGKRVLRFALIADSHLNPDSEGNTSPWETNHLANQRNKVVVKAINKIEPAFVIHLGDVVHPLPCTDLYSDAAKAAKKIFGDLKCKMYITPGNHDIGDKCLPGNPAATISNESCEIYKSHFGSEWQVFEYSGINFVIINSCHFGSNTEKEKQQWKWLGQVLNKNKRTFLFTHYPPFITDEKEFNHYDNIDSRPRKKLLDLVKKHNIEAIFAGHVHTFFLNQIKNTLSYALPSSTNFRQDYAEILRVNPAEEFGRNDLGKFGFFIIDIHEIGHRCHFIRTNGCTDIKGAEAIASQINAVNTIDEHDNFAIDLPHDWCEITDLPFNPPLDAFVRKKVRNDYSILNLWDSGVNHVRTSIKDLIDEKYWERIKLLVNLGHKFSFFTTESLKAEELKKIKQIRKSIIAIEYIGFDSNEIKELISNNLKTIKVYFSPINPPSSKKNSGPYDHIMFSGFDIRDINFSSSSKKIKADGVVIRIPYDVPVLDSVKEFVNKKLFTHLKIIFDVYLKPNKSSIFNNNQIEISKRITEAAIASKLFPNSIFRIDTFMDIDRGYFLRNGVVDRKHNPREVAFQLRKILFKKSKLHDSNLPLDINLIDSVTNYS